MTASLKNASRNLGSFLHPQGYCFLAAFWMLLGFGPARSQAQSPRVQQAALRRTATGARQASPERPVDPSKEADIRRLMDLTHAAGLADQGVQPFLEADQKKYTGNLPRGIEQRREIAEAFGERFTARFTRDELLKRIVPVYDKNFSQEEIKETLRFYESPAGRHFLEIMPEVLRESQAAAEKMSQELVPQVLQEIEAEFPELRQLR